MLAVYHTTVDELTYSFLDKIKKQFANSKIDIVIKEMDETDYLNNSQQNRAYLEESLSDIANGNIVVKTAKELGL